MAHLQRINLASDLAATKAFPVPAGSYSASIDVVPASTYTGTTWTVSLEWSNFGDDHENWNAFSPAVTFTNSTRARRAVDVVGASFIRLRTTTAAGAADPAAQVSINFY